MAAEHIDELLQQAIAAGAIPEAVTPAERAELEQLLEGVPLLRAATGAARQEARAAVPSARARFERFVAAAAPPAAAPAPAASRPKGGLLSALLAMGRGPRMAAMAAAVGVVALVAVVGAQVLTNDVGTAEAQVLTPGDYVQVQGVVSSATASGDTLDLKIQSAFGDLLVDVGQDTSIVDDAQAQDSSSLKEGDTVLVGGVVGKDLRVRAQTLALAGKAQPAPVRAAIKRLTALRLELVGRVLTFTLAPDGKGKVLIEAANGEWYLVPVDARSVQKLLERANVLGATVRVTPAGVGAATGFALDVGPQPSPAAPSVSATAPAAPTAAGGTPVRPTPAPAVSGSQPARPDAGAGDGEPSLVSISGVILSREANVLRVQTERGVVRVRIKADTIVLVGESGLTVESVRKGETVIGHTIRVHGGLDVRTGAVVADTIVVGPKPPAR